MMQHMGTESQEVISTVLEGSRCIWTGAGFAEAQEVVMEAPADMRPLLWQAGEILQPFRELLACLGVSLLWGVRAVLQQTGVLSETDGQHALAASLLLSPEDS